MSSVKEKPMKRKLFGTLEHDDKNDSNSASAEKKRRRKNALEAPKHYPKSERQQLALVLQMTSAENSPEPAGSPPPNTRKTPGGSGRKDKINKRNQRGETSLHRCTIRGDLDTMKELIRQGADVNVQDFAGWTPLHEACNHGHQEITRFLLQAGANVNSKGLEDDTPLHDAVTNSHRALVELLLKYGANPLLKNKRGETPLDIAEDQVIKELMQRKKLMQKERYDTSGSDADLQSEDSVGSQKNVEKGRTTSTSSSGFQDLFKREKKKRKKQKIESNKTALASPLSSDSSSDSDTSNYSFVTSMTNSHGGPSHPNGYVGSIVKTPSISASPLKTPKSTKKKRKHKDKSERKRVKIQSENFEDLTSSDASSDSDLRVKRQQKNNNGTHSQQTGEYSKYSLDKNDKKDLSSKPKSLYIDSNGKSQPPNTKHDPGFARKKLSHPEDQVKRARSSSHDTDFSQSKSKSKPSKVFEERLKTFSENIIPKVNGYQAGCHSVADKNSFTDESIYDFSPSAEESTNSSGISLKHKYDMKSSELFDVICLGKPSKEAVLDVKKQFSQEQNELPAMKLERKLSKDKPAPDVSTIRNDGQDLDKNHNKISSSEFSDKPVVKKTSVVSNGLHTHNHVIPKQENSNKIVETPVKTSSISKSSLTVGFLTETSGEEPKSEKKMKKHHISSTSPKKTSGNSPKASIKADISVKKELQKSDSNDFKSEKLKKFSNVDGEVSKTPSDKPSVKKKKKHKHKHSHDTPSGEHKQRHKVASADYSSSDKPTSDKGSVQNKSFLKKTDSTKSLQSAPSSRKNSYEGRPMEGSVTPAAKKKARSTDSASSETSSKGNKHSSVTKTPKSSNVSQEKRQSSVKKDKPETKKRAIISDGSSFFLSELEKSSRIRMEQDRRIKQQRKKKLLQQQRLKAQSAAENSAKDAKLNTPTSEKSQPIFTEKSFSMDFIDTTKQIRPHALSVEYQTDGNFGYRPNNMDPFHVHSNSMDRSDFSMFNKGVGANSVPQIDQKPSYSQIPPHIVQEKKHLPVQRSLSFSGQPPDVKMPMGFPHNPGLEAKTSLPLHFHEGVRHRHSMGDDQQLHTGGKVLGHPNAPTNIPPPHPVNGPLLPPANHLPPHSYVPGPIAHPVQHKPGPYQVGPSLLPGASVVNTAGNSASIPSNVPISSPLVAKVPVHPAVATPPTGSTTNASAAPDTENRPEQVPSSEGKTDKESSSVTEKTEENLLEKDNVISDDVKPTEEDSVTKKKVKTEREIQEEEAMILARKKEEERKLALEQYIKDRLSKMDVIIEEPTPKKLPVFIPMEKLKKSAGKDPIQDRLNVYEEWAAIQKQINERRKKYYTAVVVPQTPHCYGDYMTYTGAYLLSESRESWLSVPVLAPPPSLGEEMRALFVEHEKERVKLRLQHATQREKLIVACEQEIMRVHGRAARMMQNQQIPLSACSVFLDREMYNLDRRGKKSSDDSSNTRVSIRDRFNSRMMLSWLQDVDDKYVKTKNVLLQRQRHESQALHAVQRMEWFLKLQEVENQGQQKRWTNSKPEDVSELYVPPVNISDDFNLLPG